MSFYAASQTLSLRCQVLFRQQTHGAAPLICCVFRFRIQCITFIRLAEWPGLTIISCPLINSFPRLKCFANREVPKHTSMIHVIYETYISRRAIPGKANRSLGSNDTGRKSDESTIVRLPGRFFPAYTL